MSVDVQNLFSPTLTLLPASAFVLFAAAESSDGCCSLRCTAAAVATAVADTVAVVVADIADVDVAVDDNENFGGDSVEILALPTTALPPLLNFGLFRPTATGACPPVRPTAVVRAKSFLGDVFLCCCC